MTSSRTVDRRALVDQLAARAGWPTRRRARRPRAPPSAQRSARSAVRYFSGLRSVAQRMSRPASRDRLRELDQRLRRDRVLREVEVARAVLRGERRAGGRRCARRRARGRWRCRPRRGRSGRRCTCPSSSRASGRTAAPARGAKYWSSGRPSKSGAGSTRRSSHAVARRASWRPAARSRCTTLGSSRRSAASRRARGTAPSSVCSPSKTHGRVERPERARQSLARAGG